MSRYFLLLLLPFLALSGCDDDDDPVIPNEEEVINQVVLTLNRTDGPPVILTFEDLDGDGPDAPTTSAPALAANTRYEGEIRFLNNLSGQPEDITAEIREEDDEHQIFYATTVPGMTISYEDRDDNGDPIGLQTIVTTGAAGSGSLTVTLLHEPDKGADGVSAGNPDNAGGETDVEVVFQVRVE